jgi:hypothetical protein
MLSRSVQEDAAVRVEGHSGVTSDVGAWHADGSRLGTYRKCWQMLSADREIVSVE